ncbi:hypothetical protein CPB83DRAFT_864117 [Crepidotus variabilis]|uniref:BRCT domain-containing protein n=1 Tax=Crepidotus variabilis TaxID=179855 RepID=A0A9P6JJ21_9AGAR|nr:hypothetical protein CPB83DRAFT_864117 [Crepidotus variabilis]
MAPARSTTRRGARQSSAPQTDAHGSVLHDEDQNVNKQLFLDPSFGNPLQIYIEKEVVDKELLSQLIVKHGGNVCPGYSRVPYILVDPHKASGQNLHRQYAGKDGKVVLDARWVQECIKANQLQTYATNWGGCKVTGTEAVHPPAQQPPVQEPEPPIPEPDATIQEAPQQPLPQPQMAQVPQIGGLYYFYPPMPGHPPNGPAGTWAILPPGQPLPGATSPSQVIPPPPPQPSQQTPEQSFTPGWEGYRQPVDMSGQPVPVPYDYQRYRENGWVPTAPYYEYPQFPQPPFIGQHAPPEQPTQPENVDTQQSQPIAEPQPEQIAEPEPEKPRGRKRTRTQPPPATPASALVVSRNPPARSPTPPTRVIKSTYGGNLFTSDDVEYLKKYIDYCQDQCLVLSLREICERIAVKAPHHTFYSWRRYCNKHQIKLGGYTMNNDAPDSADEPEEDMTMDVDGAGDVPAPTQSALLPPPPPVRPEGSSHAGGRLDFPAAKSAAQNMGHRTRSPSPPRSLFRSTTGKGVAFTQEDVTFLMKLMTYRKARGNWDVVAFWRDVAQKAPHHSRASWMKFWRRHKHELDWEAGDEPLPPPPDKKLRYSKGDDVLLAKYFYNKPDGTSDKVFQAFGRLHPHHPWKGWQEHHRIHKAKIDQLIERLGTGENIDTANIDDS